MEDQFCPRCKTTKYRNPKLKLMVNLCGHKLCDNCVEVLFTRPSAACPECNTPLRRSDFRLQQFEDLIVEKEVDIRKRIVRMWVYVLYNKREEDFKSGPNPLRSYNDYLEEMETVIWNLANGIDVDETKKAVEKYRKDNEALIRKNNIKLGREEAIILYQIDEEEKSVVFKRKQVVMNDMEEKRKKQLENESFLNNLALGDRPLEEIVSEHSSNISKKQSVLFSAIRVSFSLNFSCFYGYKLLLVFVHLQPKDESVPLPSLDAPLFQYVAHVEDNHGVEAPSLEMLASRGYLKNIRATTDSDKAGGYTAELGCGRAIQDAFSALYLNCDTEA
ncbi:hypothetical protein QZH41_019008 [Actinostola sp. cb2023]|nr:hypothetical protein QZH41_019008 [Actinostola sp. cb2023]